MTSPYDNLPDTAFWRTAVGERSSLDPGPLYVPKFAIRRKSAIVTAGSCFAQHIGRHLRGAGCNVVDKEPGPKGLPDDVLARFGFGLYSARYGNIYTARHLMQLLDEATGSFTPAEPIWEKNGRFYDAFRPNIEPEGFTTADLVRRHRAEHLAAVLEAFLSAQIFVFTFGLTEAWIDRETGTVYPSSPGTLAGTYDSNVHAFKNYTFLEVINDFRAFRKKLIDLKRAAKAPPVRFVITVSPVPLTATASGKHVEVATAYSKAVLRAVCGQLSTFFPDIDYFPSYEVITSTNAKGQYFEANKRSVSKRGVATAMSMFLRANGLPDPEGEGAMPPREAVPDGDLGQDNEVVCEEALIEAMRK